MAIATYTYESTWRESRKVNWCVDDLIGPDKSMDFSRLFLPDSLVRAADSGYLDLEQQLILNHIRANSYLHLFILVEAFIIPMVVDQVKQMGYGNIFATQALLGFAEEEGKHIYLFQQFMAALERGFHHHCHCVGPVEDIAREIGAYPPLSVLLLTLQFEWTTQIHYLESIRHRQDHLDPCFCDLLKYHWLEEAQHTKLDTLMAYGLVERMSADDVDAGLEGYFELVHKLEQTLMAQAKLDVLTLTEVLASASTPASCQILSKDQQQRLYASQAQAYRWAFLCTGVGHPNFLQVLEHISPNAKERAIGLTKALSY
ncbi:hypothetical protein [Leptothoe spongobia]|uniref:Ferritin-like domain-containing protein n=1 Tax=Leptothoe spongobia TAU-MAC 1115 TaxID=1967444 RepID=A0A947GJD3_9CYAN|nr:hypothetical protein [Leptothoe spongobia]MBT9316900.1 hypothetical protein [Leptothoe spongobia TAU-MAC 1115]